MSAHCTHPAIVTAQAVYDLPRDIEQHEQAFLTAVHRITMECARTKGEAVQAWGLGSRAYDAVVFLADNRCNEKLRVALATYIVAHEASLEDA